MAGPAVFAFLHLRHSHFLSVMPGFEQGRMTVIAAEVHVQMQGMAELRFQSFPFPFDLTGRMTACAFSGNRKGSLAIVTGSTGFALLHLFHCIGGILFRNDMENFIMAYFAVPAQRLKMIVMTEDNPAD